MDFLVVATAFAEVNLVEGLRTLSGRCGWVLGVETLSASNDGTDGANGGGTNGAGARELSSPEDAHTRTRSRSTRTSLETLKDHREY